MNIEKMISSDENKKEEKVSKEDIQPLEPCEENASESDKQKGLKKHRMLNVCVLVFTLVLTVIALLTYFLAIFYTNSVDAGYSIASTYILCMLLAAPTLKVFLDKCTCRLLKKFTIIALIGVFVAIGVLVVMVSLSFALPCLFGQCNGYY